MAPHSSTLAWKIPWTEKPGGLQSMGSLRVGHDWTTSLSLSTFMHWRRKWQPLQCSCLENPRDGGAWWAAVYRVAQSRTRLKWLSSSSSRVYMLVPIPQFTPPLLCSLVTTSFLSLTHFTFDPILLSGTVTSDLLAAFCELFHLTSQWYFILNISFLLSSSEKVYSLRE